MMSPRIEQLVESHVEELYQAAQQSPRRQLRCRRHDGEHHATLERAKSRLGTYLVEIGQRLQTTTSGPAKASARSGQADGTSKALSSAS
jgi:hypothetical protein